MAHTQSSHSPLCIACKFSAPSLPSLLGASPLSLQDIKTAPSSSYQNNLLHAGYVCCSEHKQAPIEALMEVMQHEEAGVPATNLLSLHKPMMSYPPSQKMYHFSMQQNESQLPKLPSSHRQGTSYTLKLVSSSKETSPDAAPSLQLALNQDNSHDYIAHHPQCIHCMQRLSSVCGSCKTLVSQSLLAAPAPLQLEGAPVSPPHLPQCRALHVFPPHLHAHAHHPSASPVHANSYAPSFPDRCLDLVHQYGAEPHALSNNKPAINAKPLALYPASPSNQISIDVQEAPTKTKHCHLPYCQMCEQLSGMVRRYTKTNTGGASHVEKDEGCTLVGHAAGYMGPIINACRHDMTHTACAACEHVSPMNMGAGACATCEHVSSVNIGAATAHAAQHTTPAAVNACHVNQPPNGSAAHAPSKVEPWGVSDFKGAPPQSTIKPRPFPGSTSQQNQKLQTGEGFCKEEGFFANDGLTPSTRRRIGFSQEENDHFWQNASPEGNRGNSNGGRGRRNQRGGGYAGRNGRRGGWQHNKRKRDEEQPHSPMTTWGQPAPKEAPNTWTGPSSNNGTYSGWEE